MKRLADWVLTLAFLAGLGFLYQHYELERLLPRNSETSTGTPEVQTISAPVQQAVDDSNALLRLLEGHQTVMCPKVASKPLQEATNAGIYQWTDANGKVHFGDRNAATQHTGAAAAAQDLSGRYASLTEYLDLHITVDSATLPLFVQDKVRATVRQIFHVLSIAVPKEQLRQVTLNLRIIGTQEAFQRYKNQRAPQLQTNSGFYDARSNEAVVWQNRDEETMLEVVKHEAAHLIIASLLGPTPTWLNEGFAEYVERLDVAGQAKKITPNPYWRSVLAGIEQASLRDYLRVNGAAWYQQDQEVMYSTAWSLLYFMMDSPQGKSLFQAFIARLLEQPCQYFAAESVIDQHYPGGFGAFETQWWRWLQQRELLAHYH